MKLVALALGLFFSVVQFYTSFAALSPTPPVGYVFAGRPVAGLLVASLALAALVLGAYLIRERVRRPMRCSRPGPALHSSRAYSASIPAPGFR